MCDVIQNYRLCDLCVLCGENLLYFDSAADEAAAFGVPEGGALF
jgi:hypothetical protein